MNNNNELVEQLRDLNKKIQRRDELGDTIETTVSQSKHSIDDFYNKYASKKREIVVEEIKSKSFTIPQCPDLVKAGIKKENDINKFNAGGYQAQKDEFIKKCVAFDKLMIESAPNYKEKVRKTVDAYKGLIDDVAIASCSNLPNLKAEYESLNNEISNANLVNEKYFDIIPRIADILEEGRADRLSDALNLAISDKRDEDYKSEQLSIERQRLYELEKQTELAERQDEREEERERRWRNW